MFVVHATGRCSGKTTKLVEIFRANPDSILLTFTYRRAEQIRFDYRLQGEAHRIFSAGALDDMRRYMNSRPQTLLLIDDLDAVLPILLNLNYCTGIIATATGVNLPR